MSDEQTTATVAEPAAPAEAATVDPVLEWLTKASPDEIMKNDRIKGIFGSRIQIERERIQRDLSTEADRKARQEAEAELDRLAKEDQFAFAEKYLSKREQERIAESLANLKREARADLGKVMGAQFQSLPEWQDLTPADVEKLLAVTQGKDSEEQLAAFNATALDIIAEKRAVKAKASFRDEELTREREAIRQEEAAKRLKNGARPSLTRSAAPTSSGGWQDLPPGPEFNKAYEQWLGKRR